MIRFKQSIETFNNTHSGTKGWRYSPAKNLPPEDVRARQLRRDFEAKFGKRNKLFMSLIGKDAWDVGNGDRSIYAVVVKSHPSIVKIGMSRNWPNRRKVYADWNLHDGDGILTERVFDITNPYISLPRLENFILKKSPYPLAYRNEWFTADFDGVCAHIVSILVKADISYEERQDGPKPWDRAA